MKAEKTVKFSELPFEMKKELLRLMHKQNVDFQKVLYGNYLETKIKFKSVKYGQSRVIITQEDIKRLH